MGKAGLHCHDFCGYPDLKHGKLYYGRAAPAFFHRNRAVDAVSIDEKKMVCPESDCLGCGAWRGLLWGASPSLKSREIYRQSQKFSACANPTPRLHCHKWHGRSLDCNRTGRKFLLFLIFAVILTNCKNPVTEY